MKKMIAAWMAVSILASVGSLAAHHSLSQFDTTKAVWMKGTVVHIAQINPHSLVFVDQKGEDGKTHRWAIEGPSTFLLGKMGIKDAIKVGDVIEACGYTMKNATEGQRTISTEPISLSLKDTAPKSMTGTILSAEFVVFPNGQRRAWEDYGHHKCFGEDYQDIHTR